VLQSIDVEEFIDYMIAMDRVMMKHYYDEGDKKK